MKKIITLVFMSAMLALTSCNDFLDKYPKYGVDPESEVTNVEQRPEHIHKPPGNHRGDP